MKHIELGYAARELSVSALEKIAAAVSTSLGPKGLPFIFEKSNSMDGKPIPMVTKDGLTLLRSLSFVNAIEHAVHSFCIQASSHTVIAAGDGCQPFWSKILTPNGFIEMKDVRVGMDICGTNGSIQKILGIFNKGEKEIYEVEFSNKRIVECCEDHLWTVTNTSKTVVRSQTKQTQELQIDYVIYKENRGKQHRYFTPRTVVDFSNNEAEMPLDPYLVGVLLGDGSLSGTGSIEMSLGLKKEHIIDKLELPEGFSLTKTYVSSKNSFRVKIKGQNAENKTIHDVVDSIGLLGTSSSTKYIPKAYLYSSIQTRTKLLQGLIDTDGYVHHKGSIEFSSVSEQLANDFVDLCRSLGKTVNITKRDRKEGGSYSMTPIYRVTVSTGPKYGDKIERITATGKKTVVQCIKVSNPDNLYITDNYIATHNTTSTIVLAAKIAREILNANPQRPQLFARNIEKQALCAINAIQQETDKSAELARMVALTSSNGDEEMIEHVMKVVDMNPVFGSIVIERSPSAKERYAIIKQDGVTGGRGYNQHLQMAHSFSDKTSENSPFVVESPYVILYDGDLITKTQITPILNKIYSQLTKPWQVVILAYEVGQEVANIITQVNLANQDVKIWASSIRLTAEVNSGWHKLKDVEAFTGAKIINHGTVENNEFTKFYLGTCSNIMVTPEKTIFMGRSSEHRIPSRAIQNENAIETAATELDKERIKERNAELVNGLIKIVIGGGHLASIQERADRCDDAIKAAQACLNTGALAGCGASFIRAAELACVCDELKRAFRVIHDTIMENYGEAGLLAFEKDQTVAITATGIEEGNYKLLKIADSFESIKSVIKNGVELGILVSTLGGFALTSDLDELEKIQRVKSVMS